WATGRHRILRVELICDDAVIGHADIGLERLDVASNHPDLQLARYSGFSCSWDTRRVPPGLRRLVVRAIDVRGHTTEVSGTVNVESPLWLAIDRPVLNGTVVFGRVPISGWAAGSSPVVRV